MYIELQHIHPQYDNKQACESLLVDIKRHTDGFYREIVWNVAHDLDCKMKKPDKSDWRLN